MSIYFLYMTGSCSRGWRSYVSSYDFECQGRSVSGKSCSSGGSSGTTKEGHETEYKSNGVGLSRILDRHDPSDVSHITFLRFCTIIKVQLLSRHQKIAEQSNYC